MFNPDRDKISKVNLSTLSSSTSSAVLSSVKAERLAREQHRRRDRAALTIQRIWRGRHIATAVRYRLLELFENAKGNQRPVRDGEEMTGLSECGFESELDSLKEDKLTREKVPGALMLLFKAGPNWEKTRLGNVLERWCAEGKTPDINTGLPVVLSPLLVSETYPYVLAMLCNGILKRVAVSPRTVLAANLLVGLENITQPASWSTVPTIATKAFIDAIGRYGWVATLVEVLEMLISANQPKKKHPLIFPVIKLLTAPLSLTSLSLSSPIITSLTRDLLTIPALPNSIPIPALTHLSTTLPIFTSLLPSAISFPDLFFTGRMATEIGGTYLLANLATFGITGGMLQRQGIEGVASWMKVVGAVIERFGEGWGRWVEGIVEDDEEEMVVAAIHESEDEDDTVTPSPQSTSLSTSARSRRPTRPELPANIKIKLVLLTSSAHLDIISSAVLKATNVSSQAFTAYSDFLISLLYAFRGTSKWEFVLEATLEGSKDRSLVKRLWREGVRGKWRNSSKGECWDTIKDNPNRLSLILLSYLYCHYLLLTPDDEFFDIRTNPLILDEVLELAGIWRDLAFWGYINGVGGGNGIGFGGSGGIEDIQMPSVNTNRLEEIRLLFTRGVTRVAERNARRQFAAEDFWVMPNLTNLEAFIQAAIYEDSELSESINDQSSRSNSLSHDEPRTSRARFLSRRKLAYLSPRLGLLNNLPMAVPFQTRLEIFRAFVETDRRRWGHWRYEQGLPTGRKVTIRRDRLAEDGFKYLDDLGPKLKGTVQITFIDQFGMVEEGVDGGGLFKEFLTKLSAEVFDTNRGLWLTNHGNQLYPNPHSYATESHQLKWFAFLGRVLGKAIYEGMLVDVSFAGFFLAKWLGRQSYLDDLNSLDKELYRGLIILKNYPNPEELALNFTITKEEFGISSSVDLVPGGSEIAVTAENRHEYIQLVCKYKLDKQIAAQSKAFFSGLSDLIDPKWLRMFDQQELAQLIGGEEAPIDITDLRQHTTITGFQDGVTPHLFWKVVSAMSEEEKRALLRFVTGCSRPPLLGFAHLNPGFAIRCNGSDLTRLPSASSCFNLLKLPPYKDEKTLREKLLQSITSGAGFDYS